MLLLEVDAEVHRVSADGYQDSTVKCGAVALCAIVRRFYFYTLLASLPLLVGILFVYNSLGVFMFIFVVWG
jgi:hypothetical protein